MIKKEFFFLISLFFFIHNTIQSQFCNCIILIDNYSCPESLGQSWRFYLMAKLQSALAEQSTPILLSASLWNAFVERRISFEQNLQNKSSKESKIFNLYKKINERIAYWSSYYNEKGLDAIHNNTLVVQNINQEFYTVTNKLTVVDNDYQLLLNYLTPFDTKDWLIYKNKGGFYLLLPKSYTASHTSSGFKLNSLEQVVYAQDTAYTYFESCTNESLIDALPHFFITRDDMNTLDSAFEWNIVVSGHGGSTYQEINTNDTITWSGQPCIVNLSISEFNGLLEFFNSKVKTNFLHYSCCYAGGNHARLIFTDNTYNFPIICGTLTDCISYCKWSTLLPSKNKKFLVRDDIAYDPLTHCWYLPLKPEYYWNMFFKEIENIDFSTACIERLPEVLSFITYKSIADIPLLCLPGTTDFFPVHQSNVIKIDQQLLDFVENENKSIRLHGVNIVLLESTNINRTLIIDNCEKPRFISVKAGDAVHYLKKLQATCYIDLPTAFWQAEYQARSKLFLIDECIFPCSLDSLIFKNVSHAKEELLLKNVVISQQKNFGIRIFFTLGDVAMMVVAHKPSEESEIATIQEIITLSSQARTKYEEYYSELKNKAISMHLD